MSILFSDRRTVLLAGAGFAGACVHQGADTQEASVWEHKQISAGPNRPDFDIETPINTEVLAALHRRAPLEPSPAHTAALALLTEKGFVRNGPRGPVPAVTVASVSDGARWFAVSQALQARTVALIQSRLPEVRAATESLAPFARIGFERSSFFVLSNVLLDSWQINAVEQRFIRAERPQRGGGRYYYALLERLSASQTEAFGIYGNQFFNYDDVAFGLYGNRRLERNLLPYLSQEDIRARFGVEAGDANAARAALARRLAAIARGEQPASNEERAALAGLGLISADGGLTFPVLREVDYFALGNVAGLIVDDLAALLESEKEALRRVFERSPYVEETSFEEYLIWWYHLYYTAVTDRMAELGMLTPPANGVVTYIVTE